MSIYNVRLYEYGGVSRQLRLYKRPVTRKESIKEHLKPSEPSHTASGVQKKKKNPEERIRSPREIDHSINVSQNRTKQNIYQIARANRWEWYITLTLDPEKIDRTDYDLCVKTVRKWFNNIKFRSCPDLKYVIVPELHDDGKSWHFHGLLANTEGLTFTDSGIKQKGRKVYNLVDYKLGFTNCTKVGDTRKVSAYITKYITKNLKTSITGKRRYLASKNCDKAEVKEYNVKPEEKDELLFYASAMGEIGYMKSQDIPEAGQLINYIELITDGSNDTLAFLLESFGSRIGERKAVPIETLPQS